MGASDYMAVQPPNFAAYANPNFGLALGDRLADLPEAYMKGREQSRARQMQDMFSGGLPEKNGSIDWAGALQKYIKEGARIGGGQFMGGMMGPMLSEENARTAAALARGEQPPPSAIFGQSPIGLANSPAAQPAQTPQSQSPQPTFGQVAASYRLSPASIDSLGKVLKIDLGMKLTPEQVKVARLAIEEALPNKRTGAGDPGAAAPEETSTGATSAGERNNNGPGGANAAPLTASGVFGGPGPSAAGAEEGTSPPFARPGEASISQSQTANQRVAGGFEQAGWRPTPVGSEAEAKRLITGAINREAAAAYMEAKAPGSGKALLEQAQADRKRASEIRASVGEYNKPTQEQMNAEASGTKSPAEFEARKARSKEAAERYGKVYEGYRKLGAESAGGLHKANLAKAMINDPNFYSGPLEPTNRLFKQFQSIFGNDPHTADPQQAVGKVINDMLREQIAALGGSGVGQVRVAEVKIMEKAIANLGITPSTNRMLVDIVSRSYKDNMEIAKMAREYKGGDLDAGFDAKVAQYYQDHPLFTQEELQDPRLIAPREFKTFAEAKAAGLPKGEPVKIKGQLYHVDTK